MMSQDPGIGTKKSRLADPQKETPETYLLTEGDILPKVSLQVWIAVTSEKNGNPYIDPLTDISEPFYFILSIERSPKDKANDAFSDHSHEIHILPNEFLKTQSFSEYHTEHLRIDNPANKRRYCLGCSYQTTKWYSLSKTDTFIRYHNELFDDYVYCDNCIESLVQFISSNLNVEDYQRELTIKLA